MPAVGAATNKHESGNDFYVQVQSTSDSAKAQTVMNALKKALAKYKAAGFPDTKDWVFVELKDDPVDDKGKPIDGLSWMDSLEGETTKRCNIIIKKNQDDKGLAATAAHELFHCVQYHIPLRDYPNDAWLYESTAVWSEEFVFPTYNTEHQYDPLIFATFNKEFFDISNDRNYGGYLWWFFLYQEAGKHPSPILKALTDAKKPSTEKKALQARPNFAKEHKEYALWNYNKEPYKYYQDADGKPSAMPLPPSYENWLVDNQFSVEMENDMEPGAILYKQYQIDENVDKLRFNFEAMNGRVFDDMGIQLVYKIGGDWHYMDATYEDEVVFCRKRSSEHVTEAMLILDNGNLDDTYLGVLTVEADKTCPPAWGGFITLTWTDSGTKSDLPTLSGDPVTGMWDEKGSITIRDELLYDKEEDEFLIKKTSYSYAHSERQSISYSRPCGLLYESDVSTMSGGGTKEWEIDKDNLWKTDAPTRFDASDDGAGIYEVSLDPAVGTFVSHSESTEERNTCPLWGVSTPGPPEHSSDVWDSTYNSEDGYIPVADPNTYDVRAVLSPDRKRLTGAGDANFNYDGREVPVHVTIDYSYG